MATEKELIDLKIDELNRTVDEWSGEEKDWVHGFGTMQQGDDPKAITVAADDPHKLFTSSLGEKLREVAEPFCLRFCWPYKGGWSWRSANQLNTYPLLFSFSSRTQSSSGTTHSLSRIFYYIQPLLTHLRVSTYPKGVPLGRGGRYEVGRFLGERDGFTFKIDAGNDAHGNHRRKQ